MNINGAISCRWGTWNLAVTRFFLCAANRLVFSLCASAATFGFPTVLGCIRCHSFHLSIRLLSVNVVHFYCYQWCIVLRSHLIADTSTSGPLIGSIRTQLTDCIRTHHSRHLLVTIEVVDTEINVTCFTWESVQKWSWHGGTLSRIVTSAFFCQIMQRFTSDFLTYWAG